MIDITTLEQLGFWSSLEDYDYHLRKYVTKTYAKHTRNGFMEFDVEYNKLYLWLGTGLSEDYGFELEVRDAGHLKFLLDVL